MADEKAESTLWSIQQKWNLIPFKQFWQQTSMLSFKDLDKFISFFFLQSLENYEESLTLFEMQFEFT